MKLPTEAVHNRLTYANVSLLQMEIRFPNSLLIIVILIVKINLE